MADEEDDSQKTEDPSGRKLGKAREKGQVGSSQEIKSWMVLLGGTISLVFFIPDMMLRIQTYISQFIVSPHAFDMDFDALHRMFADILYVLLVAMWPLFLFLMVLAFFANVGQVGFIWAPAKIAPELNKISLKSGIKRMFSMRSIVEFLKGIAKLTVVSLVIFGLSIPFLGDVEMLPLFSIPQILDRLNELSIWIAVGTVAVMTAIAALDLAYQKHAFTKSMRMSKQELKDEHKQTEGDPQVKGRIRKIRMERARQRMMAAVPEADVVITNPTHYACALKYEMEGMGAPVLVAKGTDNVAFRIRDVAKENDIPIVENAPLARALYASVELDEEIPVEHYKAVAEVIGYVMRLRGDLPPEVGAAPRSLN